LRKTLDGVSFMQQREVEIPRNDSYERSTREVQQQEQVTGFFL